MFPLRDNIRAQRFPFVNYALIAVTSVVFFFQLQGGEENTLVERFGMIPQRVLHPEEPVTIERRAFHPRRGPVRIVQELEETPFWPWLTLLTCIFLHGGWLHFLGNMWFLHIFGDNVEDRLGHLGFLVFYLLTGVAASATHLATNAASPIPTIGASGAIAGVMGAYLLLFPRARVLALIPIFVVIQIIVVPASIFLLIWFALQFFQGTMAIGGTPTSGVAWWAHIGGFVAGALVILLLRRSGVLKSRPTQFLPRTGQTRYRSYGPRRRRRR